MVKGDEVTIAPNDEWTGVVIDAGHDRILIDVNRNNIQKTSFNHVFITHPHADHCHFHALDRIGRLYCSPQCATFLDEYAREFYADVPAKERIVELSKRLDLDWITVEPIPVSHSSIGCVAYYLELDDLSLLITGDWCDIDERTIDRLAATEPDILITEATRANSRIPDRFGYIIDSLEYALTLGEKPVILLNWQDVIAAKAVAEATDRVYLYKDDPARIVADLAGVNYEPLSPEDRPAYPLLTAYEGRGVHEADVIAHTLQQTPRVSSRDNIRLVQFSFSCHASMPEQIHLIEEAKPNLVILHHGVEAPMKHLAKRVDELTNVEIWPKGVRTLQKLAIRGDELCTT